jgi:tRNA-dihydrouridine synthase A
MLGLFHGRPGARTWRRILTVEGAKTGAGVEVIERGLDALREAAERAAEFIAA